ncbi:hypothetical protein CGCA056_v002020 [Colletotrichum aenigma]|uniref:uncharacterized protein n=1 Tax=Colletotrichum aenigma TaxID=1215731 RepID=UPI0018729860|nr:uncharacterized protein CGCA056_v002020 [Colletotrichum aenigma]KAF5527902.1 hypothetical protein CGCA056_v002020 [Colletotrichum aenigma]
MLADLPADKQDHISPADWDQLSTCQAVPNITSVFYTPGQRRQVEGFLTTLDDNTYRLVHNTIRDSLVLMFPKLRRILHCRRTEIQTAVCILHHVICWISSEQAAAVDAVRP